MRQVYSRARAPDGDALRRKGLGDRYLPVARDVLVRLTMRTMTMTMTMAVWSASSLLLLGLFA